MICEVCGAQVKVLLFGQRLLLCASCYDLESAFRISVLRCRLQRVLDEQGPDDEVASLVSAIRFLGT